MGAVVTDPNASEAVGVVVATVTPPEVESDESE